ncbi:DUF5719 family protein, partial [Desertihabitans aurantiacus]|uniref:DUF5719 family protein n=1 Tax=Desertihabitans aurantiacus TaxID=2282477 RepID=UPI0018E4E572
MSAVGRALGVVWRPVWARLLLVALAVAAVVVGGTLLPARPLPQPAPVPVAGVSRLVCPVPADETASVRAGVPGGEASLLELQTLDQAPLESTVTDGVLTADVDGTALLTARDEASGQVVATTTRAAAEGEDPGLSQVACRGAGSGQWLVGLREGGDARAAVVLTNPDDRQAVVNLELHDETGLLAAPGSRDIAVPGRRSVVVELGPLVRPTGALAVQVETTTGRVTAVGRQRGYTDSRPRSSEWLDPGAQPATSQVLPALPGGDGARRLVLFNPGDRRAQVGVEALGDGPYVPAGVQGQVDVPPAGTAVVELDEGFSDEATALRLTASQPVAATVEAEDPDGDLALVPARDPLTGTAAGVVGTVPDAEGELVLANAGAEPARVRISGPGAAPEELEV